MDTLKSDQADFKSGMSTLLDTIRETVSQAFPSRRSTAQHQSSGSDEYKSKLRWYKTSSPSNEGASRPNDQQTSKSEKRAAKPLGRRTVPPSEYYNTRAARILDLKQKAADKTISV